MAPIEKEWLALDIISTASIDTFSFSIDEHPLWVYAVDAHYIEPLQVDVLTVANGDRYSVFVQLNKEPANYAIRVASRAATQVIDTFAVLSYPIGDTDQECASQKAAAHTNLISSKPSINRVGNPKSANVTVFDQNKMKSFPPQFPVPAPKPAQTFFMHMSTYGNSYTWALNSMPLYHSMLDNVESPLLWQNPYDIDTSGGDLTIVTKNDTWVDLIFLSQELLSSPHPIHKHSNKAFILGTGVGSFNWSSVAEASAAIPQNFNLVTPPYRDGFVVPPSGLTYTWLAVRYHVVNPGAFMMHCHIQSHLSGGMAMIMLDGVDQWPEIPDDCKN
jgi:FtsP/CotA-like multicopper oxidase with cupredoxin domain